MFNKKGVSLITVLLFMLVATIAATATFKWLTSENRSSATRMQTQEARQSALAGIQSTRAWMTSNANDVGALVRQFILNGKQPISLNSRVNSNINSKQDFNVWLTDISETNGFFKFKILSEGNSRQNSKHTEAAILNVSGLYQVMPPEEEVKIKNIAYDYSYFGGSISNHGDAKLSSMLINGNWSGNPMGIDKNIIITGNARLSGDNVDIYGTGCIGGALHADNGIEANNLYVHGTAYSFGTKMENTKKGIYNHGYFDGIVEQGDTKQIKVGGNLTVKNLFKTYMGNGSSPVNILGNLCIDSAISQIQLGQLQQGPNYAYNQAFTVRQNVWASHANAFTARGGDFSGNYDKLFLGSSEDAKVYLPDAYPSSNYETLRNSEKFQLIEWGGVPYEYKPYVDVASANDKYYFYYTNDKPIVTYNPPNFYVAGSLFPANYRYNDGLPKRSPYCDKDDTDGGKPKLHVTPWFKSNGTVSREAPSSPIACADSVKQVCYDIWEEKPGCDGASFKVENILKTAYDKFEPYANKGCAADITEIDDSQSNDFSVKLNACYNENIADATKTQENLYNGYLVVKVSANNLKQNYRQKLKGHFIIILTNKPTETLVLPPTEGNADSDNYVFLYLQQGLFQFQSINKEEHAHYNYFIYTKADVGTSTYNSVTHEITNPQGGFLFNSDHFNGSIYAEVGEGSSPTCAKVSALTSTQTMKFNQKLLNSLNQSRVICDASVINCGGAALSSSSAGPESSSSADGRINGKDPYYISIAPRLNVTLESQYKSSEPAPAANDVSEVEPSILVLPRIIYLSKNPAGTLSDYYSVLKLNGANEVKNPSKVSCNGTFATTGKLFNETTLTPGTYNCNYTSTDYGSIPFYVVINNTDDNLPTVKFSGEAPHEQALGVSSSVTISVHIEKATNTNGKIKFDFSTDRSYEGWTITPLAGVTERSGSGNKRQFTVEVTPNATDEQDVNILTLTTDSNPDDGDLYITLSTPTELCQLGPPPDIIYHVYVRAHTSINRAPISDYCTANSCSPELLEKSQQPDCDYDHPWITINGSSCKESSTNNSWSCLTNTPISLSAINVSDIPSECEVVIPTENNTIETPVGGESETLYASLKRKRVNLTVKLRNALDKDSYVQVREEYYDLNETCKKEDSPCTYRVLAGTPITFSHVEVGEDENNFNYWSCNGDDCPNPTSNENEPQYIFYGPDTITAVFNKESHCYYDDFANTHAFCTTDEEDCIDTCATILNGSQTCEPKNSKQPKAKWLLMGHNKGSGNNASYVHPIFGTSSIFASTSQDNPSVILRNKNVGQYGTMFALVQTSIIEKSNSNDFLNSGLVFRSNGSEHLILNVYGTNKPGNTGELTFRVCKIEGQSISSSTEGKCKLVTKKEGSTPLTITSNSFIKVRLTIDDRDLLSVTAKVDDNTWEGKLSVKDLGCNSNTHAYVGFSLNDSEFKLYDNGWVSSALDETCWEVPTIKCNFVDKYKIVPLGEYVTPKVIISSWFSEKQCTTEYHYNGCDNETSSKINCTGANSNGEPGEMGALLSGDSYNFSQKGLHGYLIDENKAAQDASVKVVCPGDAGSLDLAQDYYSCGTFQVGTPQNCSKDIEIYNEAQYMSGNIPYDFMVGNGEGFNMREAKLHINIHNDDARETTLGANLKVQLQSTNGMYSLTRTISTTGVHEFNVKDLIGSTGFDPQLVTKVTITSDNIITISKLHIHSDCPNKLNLECKSATYDNANNGWKIETNAQPNEVKCSYTSSDNAIESQSDIIGCKNVILTYNNSTPMWGWMFNTTPTFTVVAEKNNATDTCTIQGTKTWSNNVTCSVDQETVSHGSDAPTFSFKYGQSIPNWNNFNINYQIKLKTPSSTTIVKDDGSVKMGDLATYQYSEQSPESGSYEYTVIFNMGNWSQSCSSTFTIQDPEKVPATLDCDKSSVDNGGRFTAVVKNPDNINYTCVFTTEIIADALGNTTTVDGLSTNASGTEQLYYTYNPSKSGTYYYTAKIGDSRCTYQKTVTSPMELQCSNVYNQDPGSTITVSATVTNCNGCTYKIFDGDIEKDNSGFTFNDPNGTGTKAYKLQATDSYGNSTQCGFTVTFNSTSNNTVDLPYENKDIWHFFEEGLHKITCSGSGGNLICKCPNAEWGYSKCNINYNGTDVQLSPSNSGGQAVGGAKNDQCKDGFTTTIIVQSPNARDPNVQEFAKQQSKGMYCKHSW